MPAKPKKRLCRACSDTHKAGRTPAHVVHPRDGKRQLYDVHGMAVCPDCGARWQRVRNVVQLVE